MKLGDAISAVATPIAGALGLDCVDEQGNLKPESKCAQRRNKLNNLGDEVWDFLWPNTTREDNK